MLQKISYLRINHVIIRDEPQGSTNEDSDLEATEFQQRPCELNKT